MCEGTLEGCLEPVDVLENTYKYVSQLEYSGKLEVHVLDDGGLDTVKALAEKYGFNYICRDNRPHLRKAGNLRYAFAKTQGDVFIIYDADFCPRKDFIKETLPYMYAFPNLAILQTPQFFRPPLSRLGSSKVLAPPKSCSTESYRSTEIVGAHQSVWAATQCIDEQPWKQLEALLR